MAIRPHPHAIAISPHAVRGPRIDYLKLVVWCAGIVLPWTALAFLVQSAPALLP